MSIFKQVLYFSVCLNLLVFFGPSSGSTVDDLVRQWAPLVRLSRGEKFLPSNVETFLNNVYVADDKGKPVFPKLDRNVSQFRTKDWSLVTFDSIEKLLNKTDSFLYGKNPTENSVSIYALVTQCNTSAKTPENDVEENGENLYFHVSYWIFYPYNEGKKVCVIGGVPTLQVFNTCLGSLKTLGNHVGDWEHMSLSFVGKNVPQSLYLAVHDTGAYYTYNEQNRYFQFDHPAKRKAVAQIPKFPPILYNQGDHPVIFSANGSHGMWAIPGENQFNKVPKLSDTTGYGVPWKTWNNVKIYHLGLDPLPYWMSFRGKWGNPKTNCLLFKKLGICEYSDGPEGIIRQTQDFYCL
ncbi:unnamed protein product [Psylliodes chrysocephalus]|uniref:Vacuolar protein sorting-associated protein 62 n=1 Tax=Psylliodes chrysocephalus TaxID=3402493 RepID=A0A9P0GJ25_9CUCU|nr:unnamed protein product [Psylliodes chrysocephala]